MLSSQQLFLKLIKEAMELIATLASNNLDSFIDRFYPILNLLCDTVLLIAILYSIILTFKKLVVRRS